uniref:Ran-binding protein 3 (Trinotate prediction) n=1 Tax=Henneguya salminicola TaxID=69463 RepID=A0A6G3MLK3_HENSL
MFEKIGEAAKYASIEHKDGEEYDENVVDIKAKMYIFESKNWQPVGLVSVRLNDSLTEADPYSRLIIRLNETHRLMVNSRISSNTACDKMQEDQIKLTIIDHETSKPKIICIKTKKADIFFKELISRIEARKIT